MTHPTENAELMNHACEVLRRYAFDLNEAMENDDLIFEADYVLQILEHESLVDATTAGGVCVCGDTLGNHPIDASETL